MAAYPATNVSKSTAPEPDAGILAESADDGTIKFRRDRASVSYTVALNHEYLTQTEFDALIAFVVANGYGPHTFTLHDINYSGTLINEPNQTGREGNLFHATSVFIADKV